jgi:membrane protease YdiL (CAAX protease family)
MTSLTVTRPRPALDAAAMAVAFAAAVAIRVAVAGPARAASVPAGLLFAGVLLVLARAERPRAAFDRRAVVIGGLGAAAIALPALVVNGPDDVRAHGAYVGWAAATAIVAASEEVFLRGALFAALTRWRGSDVAVLGAALAFAMLHVPLYGWHVLPLDLAVGLLLGGLRLATGGWAAPAVAHVGADLAGWWLA